MKIDLLIQQFLLLFLVCGVAYGNSADTYSKLNYEIPDLSEKRELPIDVRGQVVDVNGAPLIGVNVLVKGAATGTATDFEGNFELPGVPEEAVLVISYIG